VKVFSTQLWVDPVEKESFLIITAILHRVAENEME